MSEQAPPLRGTGGAEARGDESGGDTGAKPLHVRVAEALGWRVVKHGAFDQWDIAARPEYERGAVVGGYVVHIHGDKWNLSPDEPLFVGVPRYDIDWSHTGPLVERLGLCLQPHPVDQWLAEWERGDWLLAEVGETPLVAVCKLILALAAAGKLEVKAQ